MATKKAETETKTKKPETKAKVVEDDGMEEIFIPIDYSNPDEMTEYIAVNGVAILVPKGEYVKVKPEYAAAWRNTEKERDAQLKAKAAKAAGEERYTQAYINTTT